jgi:transcriptional regulator with XRE-family HTH domain
MTVGKRIREAREEKGMSRADLVRATGVPYPTLAGLENGDQSSSTQLPAIAEALGVRSQWLASGKGLRNAASVQASHSVRPDFTKLSEAVYLAQQFLKALNKRHDDLLPAELLEDAYAAVETLGDGDGSNVVDLIQFMSRRMQERAGGDGEQQETVATRFG